MKISNSTSSYINQTYTNSSNQAASASKQGKPAEETTVAPQSDSINLSDETRALQQMSRAMDTEQPERQKYVAEIKNRVQTNQYNINVDAVAEKMVGTLMDEIV